MSELRQPFQRLGRSVTERILRLGFAARFFAYMLVHSGTALRRFHLTIREIYFAGVLSLIIILVSGMFVGMVLALQGYETLQRYGSSEALYSRAQVGDSHVSAARAPGRLRSRAPDNGTAPGPPRRR